MFTLAEDVQLSTGEWLYGGQSRSDRLAIKRLGHELRAACALSDVGATVINCPLMAAFTWRGKRVLCTSALPVCAGVG